MHTSSTSLLGCVRALHRLWTRAGCSSVVAAGVDAGVVSWGFSVRPRTHAPSSRCWNSSFVDFLTISESNEMFCSCELLVGRFDEIFGNLLITVSGTYRSASIFERRYLSCKNAKCWDGIFEKTYLF